MNIIIKVGNVKKYNNNNKQDRSLQLLGVLSIVIPGGNSSMNVLRNTYTGVRCQLALLLTLETNEGVIKGLYVKVRSLWVVGMAFLLLPEGHLPLC